MDEYERIYKRCFNRAMGLAMRLLHDEDEARDAVQDVFLRLWERQQAAVSNPDAFIYRAVHNECLNRMAAATHLERMECLYPMEISDADEEAEQPAEALWQACDTLLSPRERQVVDEVFAAGHSYKQAARRLEISESTVNKHIVSALKTLRNYFNTLKS